MEAFARSMDEYFTTDDGGGRHKRGGKVQRTENDLFSPTTVPYLTYYVTLLTLMDMTLQLAYPSQKSTGTFKISAYSGFCLFINAIQVILYLSAIIAIFYAAYTSPAIAQGETLEITLALPVSLVLAGFVISLSILVNALNYHQQLTTAKSVVLNFPRISFIAAIIYLIWKEQDTTKNVFLIVLLIWVFIIGCAGPTAPNTAHGMGIVGFLGGMGCVVWAACIDYNKGGMEFLKPRLDNVKTHLKKRMEKNSSTPDEQP